MEKFKNGYLVDDLLVISETYVYNSQLFLKKPKLDFGLKNRICSAFGVLFGRYYPVYFAEDFNKSRKQ